MAEQSTRHIMMMEPVNFQSNPQTMETNQYQADNPSDIGVVQKAALKEFRAYRDHLVENGVIVTTAIGQERLKANKARFKMIATDGVFSMDGYIANLAAVCDLAEKYGALVMVDDSHAVGFMGRTGRGTHELCGVMNRVDILTGTLGKALGGASGGYTSGRREIIELLRQRSRPYLFSNTLAPSITGASLKVLELLTQSTELRDKQSIGVSGLILVSPVLDFGWRGTGSHSPLA